MTGGSVPHARCECWFLDVGQGTSNVILLGGGRAIVIDCGPRGSKEVIQLLGKYVDTIEALIISHNDADHDFNVPQVLAQYRKATKNIFFLEDRELTKLPQTFGVLKSASGDDLPTPKRLEADGGNPRVLFSENGVTLSVLYPDMMANLTTRAGVRDRPNMTSAVLRLNCGLRRVVFSGDATIDAWDYLAAQMPEQKPLHCDIMTIPHHGGNISGDATKEGDCQRRLYGELIRPDCAVVSVGTSNRYGHPKKETLSALREAGTTVLCTQATQICTSDLEAVRSLRGTLAVPSHSTKEERKTRNTGRSKDVACFGSVVAEVTDTHVQIANLKRFQRDLKGLAETTHFHPACG